MRALFRLVLFAALFSPTAAFADCSDLGIGGDIGRLCDEVSHQVTPVVQQGTVVVSTVGGELLARYYGLPTGVGAAAGNCYGRQVNTTFAGGGTDDCVGQLPAQVGRAVVAQAQTYVGQYSAQRAVAPSRGNGGSAPGGAGSGTAQISPLCRTQAGFLRMQRPARVGTTCGAASTHVLLSGKVSLPPSGPSPMRMPDNVPILNSNAPLIQGHICRLTDGTDYDLQHSAALGSDCGKQTSTGIIEGNVIDTPGSHPNMGLRGSACRTAAGDIAIGSPGLVGGRCEITFQGGKLAGVIVK